ncbi:aldo/keto reductase [Brachyspira hyodysenteriae]|uniref:aldo/keto reductase n=1 Tax=Brachyspira hyodysenteriae TaxID=159 RepID=UPI0011835989|nr:aldo/keto reductase [Brachyspira hyodysenteriae]MCZ9979981.1 aldo/keto reductase [Brachyspira hyodysenteriae]TVL64065.1 aldo/keto reductase [Brachyspira hyodysenteriae]TVL77333.1 aldo/keto reductase [Brachyspira hyodysenteriae]
MKNIFISFLLIYMIVLIFNNKAEANNMKGNFNFNTKTVKLNSGYEIPLNGIGTYSLLNDVCYNSILYALQNGVRLIDTAYIYNNEEEVGKAVRDSKINRKDIFIITKLYPNQYNNAKKAINDALKKLNVEYIDMMLLHHPGNNDVEAYKAIEKAIKEGKIRSVGLSNWYIKELKEFLPKINIMPALVQNEIHPYYQDTEVIEYIQSLGIAVQGWYPLGGRGHQKELLNDKVLKDIAAKYNKSVAQIILRWNLQRGVIVIPGSSNRKHIIENTEIYEFELSDDDMKRISELNRNEKHDWY